jgi:hypothetical protein
LEPGHPAAVHNSTHLPPDISYKVSTNSMALWLSAYYSGQHGVIVIGMLSLQ